MLKKTGQQRGRSVVHRTTDDLQHLLRGKKSPDRQWRDLDWNAEPFTTRANQ
jgi:hypothetical protein